MQYLVLDTACATALDKTDRTLFESGGFYDCAPKYRWTGFFFLFFSFSVETSCD